MVKSKSSKRWLEERARDKYVKRSRGEGYRSRASFKLLEIQERDSFIKRDMTVVDLGSAPGGWSQVASRLVGDRGRILATDIRPMEPILGVNFIQGDFTETDVFEKLIAEVKGGSVDLVISDMAPNITGIKAVDQPQAIHLAELALDFARSILYDGAYFLVKMFEGEGSDKYRSALARDFSSVKIRKPAASRARSREFYLLAEKFRKNK